MNLENRLYMQSTNLVNSLIGFGGDMCKRKRVLMKAQKRDTRRFENLLKSIKEL
jgi:hypothetical protein